MQAVFNNSWQRLTETEQAVFKRLSVFRGGFRREAAEQVARAALPILTALVDKSLLQVGANGRYQIHELLRQYAEERLRASPEDAVDIQETHCTYYVDFLFTRQEAMGASSEQQKVTRELRGDWENIRLAWQWAVDQKKVPEIYKAAIPSTISARPKAGIGKVKRRLKKQSRCWSRSNQANCRAKPWPGYSSVMAGCAFAWVSFRKPKPGWSKVGRFTNSSTCSHPHIPLPPTPWVH
jgi:hypothetical protein